MILQAGKTSFKLSFSFIALVVLMILFHEEKIIVLSLISSFIHESGHLSFMYLFGDSVKSVELTFFGMRIDKNLSTNLSYKKDIVIALGGILFNLLFAVISYIVYCASNLRYFLILAAVNFVIAIINSFPVSVLDSGKALRCGLLLYLSKESADKISDCISYLFILIFAVFSVFYFIFYNVNISLLAVNLYLIFITILKKRS